jgi:hypothetical protein
MLFEYRNQGGVAGNCLTWGEEESAATGFKRLVKGRSLGQELYNGSLICG